MFYFYYFSKLHVYFQSNLFCKESLNNLNLSSRQTSPEICSHIVIRNGPSLNLTPLRKNLQGELISKGMTDLRDLFGELVGGTKHNLVQDFPAFARSSF
jgi:hypothetical protein